MSIITEHLLTTVIAGQYTAEPLAHTPHYPADLDSLAVRRVFVTISDHGQVGHRHHFTDIDRFGDALCHPCGAAAWSPQWVRAGIYAGRGERATGEWIASNVAWRVDRVSRDIDDVAYLVAGELLGAVPVEAPVVAAVHEGSEPADNRRPGIPVPAMGYMVLSVQQ